MFYFNLSAGGGVGGNLRSFQTREDGHPLLQPCKTSGEQELKPSWERKCNFDGITKIWANCPPWGMPAPPSCISHPTATSIKIFSYLYSACLLHPTPPSLDQPLCPPFLCPPPPQVLPPSMHVSKITQSPRIGDAHPAATRC